MAAHDRLAFEGGSPTVRFSIPQWDDRTGRSMGREERRLVLEVLDSGRLGMVSGEKVKLLQEEWAAVFGVPVAVATNSGTSALHAAMIFLGIGPGDEVLVPAATDMGTVIAVLLQNAVPVFVDVQPDTMNIDPDDLERKVTPRCKAVIPVHMFGFPADMDRVMAIAGKHGLMVVEDCAQAHATLYKGRRCGTIGDVGCFSFQQTKHVTAGEGGMVIARADSLRGRKLQLCGDKGWPREQYREHLFLAPNYHISDLQAAVALAQLRKLDPMIEARRRSAIALSSAIGASAGVSLPPEVPWARHTYFAYQFTVDPARFTVGRDRLVEAIRAEGVGVLPGYLPKPLYEYDFLANVKMYNETRCPIECPHYHGTMDYRAVVCPGMNRCCATAIFMQWNEKITPSMARTMGAAIAKVLDHYRAPGT
jgi:perosamine synthetase